MIRVESLKSLISKTIAANSRWRIVTADSSLVRAIPIELEEALPPIGNSAGVSDSAWLTLHFWVDNRPKPRLGVFWRTTSVRNRETRNRVLTALVQTGGTGFAYRGAKDAWSAKDDPAFSGKTVSNEWWPSGEKPDLNAARDEIRKQLNIWTERVSTILHAMKSVPEITAVPHEIKRSTESEIHKIARSVAVGDSKTPSDLGVKSTPPLPPWVKEDRFQPHYTNIHELLKHPRLTLKQRAENSRRLYGTETMAGFNDWNAPTLLLAKDAGPMQTFLKLIKAGDPQPWRHADDRDTKGTPTNERLRRLASNLPGAKLYGSVMVGLLRNDDRQRGPLPNFEDPMLQAYIRRVLTDFVFPNMDHLRIIICLGNEACKTIGTIIDEPLLVWEFDSLRRAAEPIEYKGKLIFAAWHPVASEPAENVRRVWARAAAALGHH